MPSNLVPSAATSRPSTVPLAVILVNAPVDAEFAPIGVPSIDPELISIPVTGVVPSKRLSTLSKLVFIFVPQVS